MIIPARSMPFEGAILVSGATGTVGRLLVAELLGSGVRVKAGVRSVAKAASLRNMGARIVEIDYERPSTIRAAMAGVDRLFIITPVDNRMVRFTRQLVEEAQRIGVKHIGKLSVVGASSRSQLSLAKWHGEAEEVVADCGIGYVVIRTAMFMQNFVTVFGEAVKEGEIYAAAGEGRVPFVDVRDVARVAAEAILKGHTDRVYTLTGGQPLSMAEAAKIMSRVLKREIEYVPISQKGARSGMEGARMPEWMVEAYLELWSAVRGGNLSVVSDDYRVVVGKAPMTFGEFVRDYADMWK